MNRTSRALCLATGLALGAAGYTIASAADADAPPAAPAAPSTATDAPPADLLGPSFENQSAGISLRIPAGCHRIRTTGSGDDLGQFADDKRNWQLKLNRIVRHAATSLTPTVDNLQRTQPGLLDETVARLKHDLSGCKILRSDLTNVAEGDPKVKDNVGMIAVEYPAGGGRYLSQQAIIQGNDRLFYLIALTVPDKDERDAVETFRQMIDSVHLLDTSQIVQDQDERLILTRNLMVGWTAAKLHSVLIDEQWVRILRDGKDIGYSYVTEQTAAGVPRPLRADEVKAGKSDRDLVKPGDGVLIGVRARSIDPAANVDPDLKKNGPVQVDSATWMFTAPDRKLEDWSRIIVADYHAVDKAGKPIKSETEEFGSSNKATVGSLDENKPQSPIRVRERNKLDVITVSQSGQGEPVSREVPGWYVSQALAHLLPRLVPLHPQMDEFGTLKRRSFLFAVYVPDTREVMHRYIDVKDEQDLTFDGRTIHAVPIEDRIGWRGSVTVHYMTTGGVYLGSENKDTHLIMLPTDAKTLLSIWKNADLTRPGGTARPRGSASSGFPTGGGASSSSSSSSAPVPFGPQPLGPAR